MVANVAPAGLPAHVTGSRSTGWWAIVILIMIESTVFASLIASYFYLFSGSTVWPPDGTDAPKLLLPSINAVILWTSVIPAYLGDRAIARGDNRGLRWWRLAGSIMLVVFLVLKYVEYSGLDYRWDTNAYGSIVWTITGFHTAHVLVVLLKTVATQVLAWKGFWNERRRSAVQGTTLYWFFVAGAWVPLFTTLYLFPNFL
ncbi:MAG: heme-copper oxidase subunit III [Chloroflexota bacterium]|nr:heme-copper oxidase subunit III [Chloroflexota bacterium]